MQGLVNLHFPDVTSPAIIVAASLFFASIILLRGKKTQKNSSPRDPSLPPQCEIITWKEHMEKFMGPDAPEYLLNLTREMGHADYEVPRGPIPFLPSPFILTDHQSARKALEDSKSTKVYLTGLFFNKTTNNGPNIVTAEGHRWKHVRASTAAAFNGANLKRMVEPIDAILEKWIETVLEPCLKDQTPIDILNEMNLITANVIVDVAFDYEFQPGERKIFLEDLNTCWEEFGVKGNKNIFRQLPVTELLFPSNWKGKRAAERMFNFCGKLLRTYTNKKEADQQQHKLIHMIANDEEYEDDGERCRDMIAYVIAGFDTTANSLSFALRELAMNQSEQQKLRSELRSAASPDEARNCKQLKMVTKEITRMYPAAALGSVRKLGRDLVLPSSKKVIPKDSLVLTQYYCIQRDPSLFENPDAFLPLRWENPTSDQIMSLMTFSAGRRSCQGQGLASLEMNEILYKLISKYKFSIVEKGEPQSVILFKPVGTLLSVSVAE